MAKKGILIIDFDGVICDSINECFLVAYNAYSSLKDGVMAQKWRFNFDGPLSLKRHFFLNRHLVRPAKEYFILFKAFDDSGNNQISEKKFKYLANKYKNESLAFGKEFYKTRERFRRKYPKKWLRLHKIYPGIAEGIRSLSKTFKIYVSTTKDRGSVKALFLQNRIKIADRFIYTKERGLSKSETVKIICVKNGRRPEDVWFIDDNITYLDELLKLNINCCLAKWGYISKDSVAMARKKKYKNFAGFNAFVQYLKGRKES
ncbi:MAG: HAD hydrolase-like protein [Candidatus Omnitrophota bacterium]|nr:HAD hydrolase-like protein [Candidatus Omnitrophota bacterium]